MDANDITAWCAVMGVIGAIFLFSVNAIVGRQLEKWQQRLDGRFASRERVDGIDVRVGRLETPSARRAHAGGD